MIQPQPIPTQLSFAMMGNQPKMPSRKQMDEVAKLSMGENLAPSAEAMGPLGRNPMPDIYGMSMGYAGSGRKPTSLYEAGLGAPKYMGLNPFEVALNNPMQMNNERFGILGKEPQTETGLKYNPSWMRSYQVPQFPNY